MNIYNTSLKQHYDGVWNCRDRMKSLDPLGRIAEVRPEFEVLEIAPWRGRSMWTYATVEMAGESGDGNLELHAFSDVENPVWQDILESIAHFHLTVDRLALGHTVNFGVALTPGSNLTHGLISLPFLDGPALETFTYKTLTIRCLWLIPITQSELQYKKQNGLEALEQLFEKAAISYADPMRVSVV